MLPWDAVVRLREVNKMQRRVSCVIPGQPGWLFLRHVWPGVALKDLPYMGVALKNLAAFTLHGGRPEKFGSIYPTWGSP